MLNNTANDLAGRIRALRCRQGRTLQEIADACAVTPSMLCKVEKGSTNPTAALLVRLAHALGVPMAALLEDGREVATVFSRRDDARPLTPTDKGYHFFAFAAGRMQKAMQPFLFRACKGEVRSKPLSHPGEEFVYILRGELKYRLGQAEYHLGPGDSLYFDAEQDHDLSPVTQEVEYLAVFCDALAAPRSHAIAPRKRVKS